MKTLVILLGLTSFSSSFASELADCETKIASLLNQVKTSEVKLIQQKTKTGFTPLSRVDQYHMSSDRSCGVELVKDKYLTVTQFKAYTSDDSRVMDAKKFETIMLHRNDPTFSEGRVRAEVTCEISDHSVEYITKVPVLTDGMKTPYAVEKLTITQTGSEIYVRLRTSVTPIHGVFRSITDCTLTAE